MNLRSKIEEVYKDSIRNKGSQKINTLRLIKSAIKDKGIASRNKEKNNEISDEEILLLLQNLVKQRKDSIESFKLASRKDLITIEQNEIEIINSFLPKQMDENETESLILEIIDKNNFNSIKDMGKLMNELKSNYSGKIDMTIAGKIAKSRLLN